MEDAVKAAGTSGALVEVMIVDLDGFKRINDTVGYAGGDALLKSIGEPPVKFTGSRYRAARFGGDEFLIMVQDVKHAKEIESAAQGIVKVFKEPFEILGQQVSITAGLGVSLFPLDGDGTGSLIKHAYMAVHQAKIRDKNQYALCTPEPKEISERNIILSTELYGVEKRGELVLHYQPQMNLRSGRMIGAEALVRWQRPGRGLLPPGLFIPLAEMNGTIMNIGE